MAEHREKCGHLYIKRPGQEPLTFELYDSRQWPNAPEAGEGLYRVKVNGKWLEIEDRKYTFLTYQAIELIAFRQCATGDALNILEQDPPAIAPKQRLHWTPGDISKPKTIAWAVTSPYLGIDGQWRVPIYYHKKLKNGVHMVPGPHVPLDEVTLY